MVRQEVWKLTKTKERELSINSISKILGEDNFSKCMDIILELSLQRLAERDQERRNIQDKIKAFKLCPQDFEW